MLTRVILVLLFFCMWTQSQRLDSESWVDQAVASDGLCRYGNSVECCWGWRPMDRRRCQPHCQQGCKHGECVGPDRCKCHPGYTGKACNQDLNECGVKPRPCKHRCMNTPGSYKCYCLDGFTAQPDGSCRNARTCYHANCQYGCEVIKGAVRCTCPSPGLRLGPDRRTCVDIDECVSGGGVCPRRRKCVNTFGSFMCKCHLGFKLMYINGRYSCIDKDTRPFCSLNPGAPKCRCNDGSCAAVLRVTVEPQRPRTTSPARTTTPSTTTTAAPPTTTPAVLTTATTAASASAATTRSTPVPTTATPSATSTTPSTTPATPSTTPTTPSTTPATPSTTPTTPSTTPATPSTTPTTPSTTPATPSATPTTPSTTPATPSTTPTTPSTTPTTASTTPATPSTTPATPATPSTTPTTPSTTPTTPSTTPATTSTTPTTPSTTPTPLSTTAATPTTPSTTPTTPSTTPSTTDTATPVPTTTPSTAPSTTDTATPVPTTTPTTPSTTPVPTTTPSTTPVPTTTPSTTPTTTSTTALSTTPAPASSPPLLTPTPTVTTTTRPTTSTPTTLEPTTVAPTMPSTVSLVTTTVNNRINKEVTNRQRGDVHIPRHPGHNQVWEFDIELGNTAEDARDDPEVGVLRCTFNHGLCDWMSDREGDLHWETVHNPAGGRYLSVPELKAGQRSIRGARLAVQIVPPWSHGDLCFSFSHWLTGHHVGVLQLFVKKRGRDQRYSPALWSRTGGHGWRHTQVTLTTHSLDKVLLKAERRRGQRGQMAVDDVTLRPGACR